MDIIPFFAAAPQLHALYLALEAHIRAQCGDCTAEMRKTQISFRNRHLFAWVSLPPSRKTKPADHLILGFGLGWREDSPRIIRVSEPYPGRWTHHVLIRSTGDIDDELTGWLRSAYAFAQIK